MFGIEGEIVIERPVEEVFDFAADECNEPRYNPICGAPNSSPMGRSVWGRAFGQR